ncbi:uncharacterized protein LY89DRAFT_686441 [Mollisia scopiformis]|uniref:RNA polymerase II subunit A C-terminal domain phosphatase n=1 Tax=Mollisia scopiformis TaxID=149040 RepID=A0A194X418_MOLSC|nr:uncharacterized protein LY89DRAFT_686441 [Mollisia scopiformis]KUJ14794.1 hypothetical protein LY89DRAFT_686441 [Mollisia scopiformis]
MGKLLSLGTKLKYPITICKLLKQPGDEVSKQQPILEYKFEWTTTITNEFGDDEELPQTTIAGWDSPAEGTLTRWKVYQGQVIEKDLSFVEIEETCSHSVQFAGLCAMCGKDMTERSWASASDDTNRATVNMIHDQTTLKVSEERASEAEEELQRRLLKHRKLSLVVDLDQTIIHACIEPTVGEWQNDPTSPNYEAVKDVKAFQLDDGPRGLASGCWYYIKMRPGLSEFLAKIAEMYELHVYTMGTRAYAMNIAKIVDPDKKLFGDRIISRDENGNITTKSLARLFPVDTKMVVIIDDRADVWPKNRPNLIKVVPYDFFLGIGDINSSFLPKREELPKMTPALKKRHSTKSEESNENGETKSDTTTTEQPKSSEENGASKPVDGNRVSALEELVKMGGGDDQALRLEQAAEQEKFLEKQLTERPLLHMQEQLDKEDGEEDTTTPDETNGEPSQEHSHHRHNLLKDDDVELMYLEKHLSQLHKAFYDEYDSALVNAHGGRVAQLKPGHKKKVSIKDDSADLKIVPDIGNVMPRLKSKTLAGCVIVMSGLVPLQADILRSEIGIQAASFGAEIQTKVNRKVTHLVASTSRTRTTKVRQAAKYPNIKIVNQQWLLNSMSKWEKEDETPYLVQIHDQDRIREEGFDSSAPSSIHDSDESEDADSEDEAGGSLPASQDELDAEDVEGLIPAEMEEGHSPIDDLKKFDWEGVDDELNDFLGDDDDDSANDSDASQVSNASRSSKLSVRSKRGVKRQHGETTDDSETDEEGALSKRIRTANSRTTGLKTVKTPNSMGSESSLPTPGVTGDEDDVDQIPTNDEEEDLDEDDDELEKEIEAAFGSDFEAEMEVEGVGG